MTNLPSRPFTGICLIAGVIVLAGLFHDPATDEPWGWTVAVVLAAGVIAGVLAALTLLLYLPRRIARGPARSFRVLSDGRLAVSAFAYPPMWAKLRSLAPAGSSMEGAGFFFFLVVDGRGVSFREGDPGGGEIAFVEWSQIEGVAPAVISHGSRASNGVSATIVEPGGTLSIDFTCAREGAIGVYGRQARHELEELCRRISAQNTSALGSPAAP